VEHNKELTACAGDKDEEQEIEGGKGKTGFAVGTKCSENIERFCIGHGAYLRQVRRGGGGAIKEEPHESGAAGCSGGRLACRKRETT
jgi:hypothetical protein